jgi:hypothetical protein
MKSFFSKAAFILLFTAVFINPGLTWMSCRGWKGNPLSES